VSTASRPEPGPTTDAAMEVGTAAPDAAPVLVLDGVEKAFATPAGPRPVLLGVDLAVAAGEVVAMAGRSGSGKTTLLTIVAGWERPDAGRVALFGGGRPPDRLPWADLAILPQSLGLLDELTVAENVTLPLRLGAVRPGEADGTDHAADHDADGPDALLRRLGVDHLADRYPTEVSLGERQRAALARAAVLRPRLLLADEPIAHQNHAWAEAMTSLLRDLADGGSACLLATHNPLAFAVADRVVRLDAGRLGPLAG
jgi:putative ABC transport system ATP-binding protein